MTAADSANEEFVLAVDLGSGGPKVGIVTLYGKVVAAANEPTSILLLPNGGAEQEPKLWWQAVVRATRQVLATAGIAPQAITAIACTSQWAVTVPIDANGEPLMNAVHWLDTRGGVYNRRLTGGFPSVQGYNLYKLYKWMRTAGLPPTHSGVDALGHMLYIKHECPEVYAHTYKFLEPMDYLNLRLTGRCAGSQITVLPMLLTNNREGECLDYDPWLVAAAGIDRAKLPDLLPIDSVLGTLTPASAAELGLAPHTTVLMAANDNHTAAIGAGAVAPFDCVAVLGTSGFLAGHLPFKKSDLFHLLVTIPSPFRDMQLLMAELGNTGKVLDSYLHHLVFEHDLLGAHLAPPDLYPRASQLASQAPPGSDGVLFLPWFNGSLTPSEDANMRGGFLNLSHHTTRAHMTRAVLEGIAYNWRWMVEATERFVGRRFTFLRLGGGGALSALWAQIMADVLGIPIHQLADPRYANVRGAALLAFHRLGRLPRGAMADHVEIAQIFTPQPGHHPLYTKRYAQFRDAYRRTRPLFRARNRS